MGKDETIFPKTARAKTKQCKGKLFLPQNGKNRLGLGEFLYICRLEFVINTKDVFLTYISDLQDE